MGTGRGARAWRLVTATLGRVRASCSPALRPVRGVLPLDWDRRPRVTPAETKSQEAWPGPEPWGLASLWREPRWNAGRRARCHQREPQSQDCGGYGSASFGVPLPFSLYVIASAAKQSSVPCKRLLDCFVAIAPRNDGPSPPIVRLPEPPPAFSGEDRCGERAFVHRQQQLGRQARRENGKTCFIRHRDSGGGGPCEAERSMVEGARAVTNSAASGEVLSQAPRPPHFVRSPLPAIAGRDEASVAV